MHCKRYELRNVIEFVNEINNYNNIIYILKMDFNFEECDKVFCKCNQ